MSELRDRAQNMLERLASKTGVIGAAVVTRDGLPVLSRFPTPVDTQTLSAMCAAALAAMETASLELGGGPTIRILAEGERNSIMIEGVDDRHIVIAVSAREAPVKETAKALDETRGELQALLAG